MIKIREIIFVLNYNEMNILKYLSLSKPKIYLHVTEIV